MNRIFLIIALLLAPVLTSAQSATSANKFAFDQAAPTLADANAYTYKYYTDGSTTANTFTGVTCTGAASPFVCVTNIPAFTPGNHSITMTASNIAGESAKSAPFAFTFVVTPVTPANIRIQ